MKGHAGWFILLSAAGIIVGLYMFISGINGQTLGSFGLTLIGLFVVIKEILDIVH